MKDLAATIIKRLVCLCNNDDIKIFDDTINFGVDNNYESIKNVKEIKGSNQASGKT